MTFIVSGRLWRNSMIMQDEQTGSYWSHITGAALLGELKGTQLRSLTAVQTDWEKWYGANPDTKVLKKEAEIRSSSYEGYFNDPRRTGIFRARYLLDRLPGKELVHGLHLGVHALAVTDALMEKKPFLRTRLNNIPIVLIRTNADGVRAFEAGEHRLYPAADEKYLRDEATGSLWKAATGRCVDGRLRGSALKEIPVTVAYWFAWSNFYPNTLVLD